ncbi:MAG: M48 family metalloprotease [Phenylobacterium sp.]
MRAGGTLLSAVSAALTVAALTLPAGAGAVSLPGGDKFSVSGKKGPFVKQVANRMYGVASAETKAGTGAMGLSDAVNRGEFQAARLRMPQTEARIAALLEKAEANWPYDKSTPIRVYVLGLDFYSAYALPDGSLMVAFGLLEQARSDDEVAFVLSHELSHVRLGHFAKDDTLAKRAQLISRLGQAYAVSSALRNGSAASAANAEQSAAGQQADATNDLIHFLNNVMSEPAWSRNQEDEADALGFDLAQAADYSAESASARVFDTIQADATNRKSLTDTLDAQLKSQLSKVSPAAATSVLGGPGGIRGGLLRGAGRVALGVAGAMEGGPKHRAPEARKAGIAAYSADAYPKGLPLRDEQVTWLNNVRRRPEYAEAQVVVPAVRQAMTLRAKGDYSGAAAQLALASKTSFAEAPLVLNEAARLRGDQGDVTGAAQLFQRAHRSPEQTIDGYLDHARMLFRTGHPEPAFDVIAAGQSRFEDEKPFLSLIVALDRQAGRMDAMQAALAHCREAGDEALKKDCELAAGGR